jgi:CNP1-like family
MMKTTTMRTMTWVSITMNKTRLFALVLAVALPVSAQVVADDPDWKEGPVPPAPLFDLNRLVKVEVSAQSALQWGIDTQTIQVSKSDSVVRYVIVARSPSGVVNAMYEGLRCNKAEVGSMQANLSGNRTGIQAAHAIPGWRPGKGFVTALRHPAPRNMQLESCETPTRLLRWVSTDRAQGVAFRLVKTDLAGFQHQVVFVHHLCLAGVAQ